MGGVTLLLSGDFRQTLPVIPKGSRADEVLACLKSSTLWPQVKTLSLSTNMRAHLLGDSTSAEFAEDILALGEWKVPKNDKGDISISELCNTVESPSDLLETVFPNLESNYADINWLSERTILAPKNVAVSAINDQLISRIPGEERIYKSIDRTCDLQDIINYPIEFLNSLEPAGLPPHILRLMVECPIMLIRNLLPPKQCNGTRLAVKSLMSHLIVTGCGKDENIFISRMHLYPSESDMPFHFRRSQFPQPPPRTPHYHHYNDDNTTATTTIPATTILITTATTNTITTTTTASTTTTTANTNATTSNITTITLTFTTSTITTNIAGINTNTNTSVNTRTGFWCFSYTHTLNMMY
uniref:ATP-dependent DNA helicase n=1 Tax=Octopus bimaculoides TaxID=37653 RepID=A0A0L8FLC9_OCTBM